MAIKWPLWHNFNTFLTVNWYFFVYDILSIFCYFNVSVYPNLGFRTVNKLSAKINVNEQKSNIIQGKTIKHRPGQVSRFLMQRQHHWFRLSTQCAKGLFEKVNKRRSQIGRWIFLYLWWRCDPNKQWEKERFDHQNSQINWSRSALLNIYSLHYC